MSRRYMFEELSNQLGDVQESLDSLHFHIRVWFRQLSQGLGLPLQIEAISVLQEVQVPVKLADCIKNVALQKFSPLESAPIGPCIDAAVHHFGKAKCNQTVVDRASLDGGIGGSEILTILDLMISQWILTTVRDSESYRSACSYSPGNAFEQRMKKLGMTVDRFVRRLHEVRLVRL